MSAVERVEQSKGLAITVLEGLNRLLLAGSDPYPGQLDETLSDILNPTIGREDHSMYVAAEKVR